MNFSFNASNQLQVVNYSYFPLISTPVYRDASAWYHIVWSLDTTQATASNRMKLYVNGAEVTTFGTDNRSSLTQNSDQAINQAAVHYIGGQTYLNAYLADIHFIDGQALTPSSFGEFDTNGVWQPIDASGLTFGTNGFHLPFSDNSTAAALGTDTSGNGNTWTVNNLSVTAGSGNDSLVDTPTSYGTDTGAGGEVRGNYCTWNPLANTAGALSNGNLQLGGTSGASVRCNSTLAISSGKWYFESTLTNASAYTSVGVGQGFITNQYPGQDALSYAQTLEQGTSINNNSQPAYGTALTSGDVFMCAFDLDNNKIFFGKTPLRLHGPQRLQGTVHHQPAGANDC
jgi:hypothetical protein